MIQLYLAKWGNERNGERATYDRIPLINIVFKNIWWSFHFTEISCISTAKVTISIKMIRILALLWKVLFSTYRWVPFVKIVSKQQDFLKKFQSMFQFLPKVHLNKDPFIWLEIFESWLGYNFVKNVAYLHNKYVGTWLTPSQSP